MIMLQFFGKTAIPFTIATHAGFKYLFKFEEILHVLRTKNQYWQRNLFQNLTLKQKIPQSKEGSNFRSLINSDLITRSNVKKTRQRSYV